MPLGIHGWTGMAMLFASKVKYAGTELSREGLSYRGVALELEAQADLLAARAARRLPAGRYALARGGSALAGITESIGRAERRDDGAGRCRLPAPVRAAPSVLGRVRPRRKGDMIPDRAGGLDVVLWRGGGGLRVVLRRGGEVHALPRDSLLLVVVLVVLEQGALRRHLVLARRDLEGPLPRRVVLHRPLHRHLHCRRRKGPPHAPPTVRRALAQ